jgi:hypothetical protein
VGRPQGRALIAAGLLLVLVAGGVAIWQATHRSPGPVRPTGPTSRISLGGGGGLSGFSQLNRQQGSLTVVAHAGRRAAQAVYHGGGANGYARAIYNVHWRRGQSVAYGAAFYIPRTTVGSIEGQLALMRWDDYPAHPEAANYGGLVIFVGDHRAHLIRNELGGKDEEDDLVGAFDLPLDRWFTVEVRQRLGAGDDARNEVYVNGRAVASSNKPNIPGDRDVRRVRYGVTAIAAGAQRKPLLLWFDDAWARPGVSAGG